MKRIAGLPLPRLPMLRLGLLLLAGLAGGGAGPCGLERAAELALVGNRLPVVDVRIAGQTARLIVDSGAAVMVLNKASVERLGLRYDTRQRYEIRGIGGGGSSFPAIVTGLRLGGVELPEQRAAEVPPGPNGPALAGVDGLLSIAVLRQFDVAINMAGRRMVLYRGRPCDAGEVPLSGELSVVPTRIDPVRGLLGLPVLLDNTSYRAMLDTGAMGSMVVDRVAGLSDWALGGDRRLNLRGVGPDKAGAHRHQFRELVVGDDTVERPALLVAEDAGTSFDFILGMDYLASRPFFISFSTNRLYLTKPRGR